MYIFINTTDNAIMMISETLSYQDNGNYIIKNGSMVLPKSNNTLMVEVDSLPENFDERGKYCYTEDKGFYLNEEYMKVHLAEAKQNKIDELDKICTQTIYNGKDVTLSDGNTYHFTLDEQDQDNLTSLSVELSMGAEQIEWHTDNHDDHCRFYSAEDAQTIIQQLSFYKKYNITYFRDLRIYVNSLDNMIDVEAIEYGCKIPDEFKSEVLKYYESMTNNA